MPIRKPKTFSRVSWSEFLPAFTKLEALDSMDGVAKSLGYSHASTISDWKKSDSVPLVAKLAAEFLVAKTEDALPIPKTCLLVIAGACGSHEMETLKTVAKALSGLSLLEVDL